MNPNRTKHVAGTVIGVVLLIGAPIVARMLYVSGMHRAFVTLGSGPGIADPVRLSSDINAVLYACAGGFGGSLLGLVILIVSLVLYLRAGRRLSTPNAISMVCFTAFCASFVASAADVPPHIKGDFELAKLLLASKHKSIPLWPDHLDGSVTLRCPKPINSSEELKAVLATAPKTFHQGERFGDIVEFNGWFAASLDSPNTPPGKSVWIVGIVVQKGSSELCGFSHW